MDEILNVNYATPMDMGGKRAMLPLNLTAQAGENIFLHCTPNQAQRHFEVLCGLNCPDSGQVYIRGQNLYAMEPEKLAAFRRDHIGGIPAGGGLIPELPMIGQITLPMKLAGESESAIAARLEELASPQIPLHSLYSPPGRVPVRKAAYAALLRAVIRRPQIIVVNGFLDEFDPLTSDALWAALLALRPEGSVLICLSSAPAPEQVNWTQQKNLAKR